MAQVETIGDVFDKKGSIVHIWRLIDPDNHHSYSTAIKEWYRLSLVEQRKLYLYLLYRKWRGIPVYGTPYDIITGCHPAPFNWDGRLLIDKLLKEGKIVSAKYKGSYGLYTRDEARVWQMEDVHPRK
jgi:hypothetical protein